MYLVHLFTLFTITSWNTQFSKSLIEFTFTSLQSSVIYTFSTQTSIWTYWTTFTSIIIINCLSSTSNSLLFFFIYRWLPRVSAARHFISCSFTWLPSLHFHSHTPYIVQQQFETEFATIFITKFYLYFNLVLPLFPI
jgi:hypothetical protein